MTRCSLATAVELASQGVNIHGVEIDQSLPFLVVARYEASAYPDCAMSIAFVDDDGNEIEIDPTTGRAMN